MLRAGIHSGEYYEATTVNGELVGFLMTMPPGDTLFSTYVHINRPVRSETGSLIAFDPRSS